MEMRAEFLGWPSGTPPSEDGCGGKSAEDRKYLMTDGWDASAKAWIETMGTDGDWGRRYTRVPNFLVMEWCKD
jgi:hypothetical protein